MDKTAEQLRREHIALEGDTHGKNKWAILFTVLIMTFMACLDSTVVTVALPVMQKELGVGLDRIQLVSSVYLLATCVAMLPFGRLGDVHGKVGVFQLGVIVFTVGSLLCGPRHDVWPRARRHAGGTLSLGEHLPHQPAHWRHLVYRGALHTAAC